MRRAAFLLSLACAACGTVPTATDGSTSDTPSREAQAQQDTSTTTEDIAPIIDSNVSVDAVSSDEAPPMDVLTQESSTLDAMADRVVPNDVPRVDVRLTDVLTNDVVQRDSAPEAGGSDAGAMMSSSGCGMAPTIALNTYVARSIMVGGTMRDFYVRLPTGYNPMRAYPIVYQLHGCSSAANRQDNNVPVHNASGTEAIHVRGRAAGQCWDTATTGPDVPYIDAMIAAVEASHCVNTQRRFLAGYSSGSFMSHRLACIRGAMFRGVATIAGGQAGNNCTGNVAALLIHDTNDGTVNISASVQTRDNHVQRNRCNAMAPRVATMRPPCEAYTGCDPRLPVVWCQTSGMDHSRQDSLAAPAFWEFFASLN